MLAWIADRLILRPTRHTIPCETEKRWIAWESGRFAVWIQRANDDRDLDLLVLKFPGTGGRAERSTSHPADAWSDLASEVWAINPPGYGDSPGRASLTCLAAVAEAVWSAIEESAEGRPVVVTGNSLGTLPALYLAAHFPVAGLLLRNPVPLRDVILSRYGWMASIIARQVPKNICPIANARLANVPAVIVSSAKDRIVPANLQQKVIAGYVGESRLLSLSQADHADPPQGSEVDEYQSLLDWLRQQVLANK